MNTNALATMDVALTDLTSAELATIEGGNRLKPIIEAGKKVYKWFKECGAALIVCFDSGFNAS